MRVIFCDSLAAAELCPGVAADSKPCHFIAISPAVMVRLQELGLPVTGTLPYFSSNSHERALLASREAVDRLRAMSGFVDLGLGLQTAYRDTFIYWFRFVAHYALFMLEVISSAAVTHRPTELIAFSYDRSGKNGKYAEPEDNYLKELARAFALKNGIKFRLMRVKAPGISLKRFASQAKLSIDFLRALSFKSDGKGLAAKPILLTSPLYRMDKVAAELTKEFSSRPIRFLPQTLPPDLELPVWSIPWFFPGRSADFKEQKRLFARFADEVGRERSVFSANGISYSSILADKLRKDYLGFVLSLLLDSLLLDRQLRVLGPALVISNVCRIDDLIIAELCRARGIPNLLLSHGSHVKPKNQYETIEWGEHGKQFLSAPFSHIAVQTPTTMEYFSVFPTKAALVKTGPVTWGTRVDRGRAGELFKTLFDRKFERAKVKVIMHAGTPKGSNALRFFVYETSAEYIQGIRDLAEAVNRSEYLLLVVKFRPSKEISLDTLKKLVPFSGRVVLSVGEPLLDVLGMADLVVSFSSTAIDEALQNRVSVLLYGGGGRYSHVAASSAGPVYKLNSRAELDAGLRSILSGKLEPQAFDPYIYPETERSSIAQIVRREIGIS